MDEKFPIGSFFTARIADLEPVTGFVTDTKIADDESLLVKLSHGDESGPYGNWYPADSLSPAK